MKQLHTSCVKEKSVIKVPAVISSFGNDLFAYAWGGKQSFHVQVSFLIEFENDIHASTWSAFVFNEASPCTFSFTKFQPRGFSHAPYPNSHPTLGVLNTTLWKPHLL